MATELITQENYPQYNAAHQAVLQAIARRYPDFMSQANRIRLYLTDDPLVSENLGVDYVHNSIFINRNFIAGFSTAQLQASIAHEYGHFYLRHVPQAHVDRNIFDELFAPVPPPQVRLIQRRRIDECRADFFSMQVVGVAAEISLIDSLGNNAYTQQLLRDPRAQRATVRTHPHDYERLAMAERVTEHPRLLWQQYDQLVFDPQCGISNRAGIPVDGRHSRD